MVLACQQVGRWNGFSTSFHRNNNDLGFQPGSDAEILLKAACESQEVNADSGCPYAGHSSKSEEPSTCAGVSMRTTISSSSNSLLLLEDPRARERALQILRHPLHSGHRSGKTLVCIVYHRTINGGRKKSAITWACSLRGYTHMFLKYVVAT